LKNFTDGEEIKLRHWKKYEDLLVGGEKNTAITPVGKTINLQYDTSNAIIVISILPFADVRNVKGTVPRDF
jgi:hypothetical protein